MLSATSGTLRLGAGRIVPRAASVAARAVRASPSRAPLGRQVNSARCLSTSRSLGYVATTNPNPPLGKTNASNDAPSRIGLIGARGYTGQALIDLLDKHPFMDLQHVSSRELAGQQVDGYTKRKVTYESLSPEDVAQLDKNIDCWVMALPNGVCKPYINALNEVQKDSDHKSVIVDLSADHRFDDSWAYGLPELTKRSTIAQSIRISNPGCYATAAQLAISPLRDVIASRPTVFGVSGYSGAGTKKSLKNDVEYLTGGVLPCALSHPSLDLLLLTASTRFAYRPHPRA